MLFAVAQGGRGSRPPERQAAVQEGGRQGPREGPPEARPRREGQGPGQRRPQGRPQLSQRLERAIWVLEQPPRRDLGREPRR